jgi:hypothetical protein
MIQINTAITAKTTRTDNARRYQHTCSIKKNLPFSPKQRRHDPPGACNDALHGRDATCTRGRPAHRNAGHPRRHARCDRCLHSLPAGTPTTCATVPDAAATCRFLHAAHARPSCMPEHQHTHAALHAVAAACTRQPRAAPHLPCSAPSCRTTSGFDVFLCLWIGFK